MTAGKLHSLQGSEFTRLGLITVSGYKMQVRFYSLTPWETFAEDNVFLVFLLSLRTLQEVPGRRDSRTLPFEGRHLHCNVAVTLELPPSIAARRECAADVQAGRMSQRHNEIQVQSCKHQIDLKMCFWNSKTESFGMLLNLRPGPRLGNKKLLLCLDQIQSVLPACFSCSKLKSQMPYGLRKKP